MLTIVNLLLPRLLQNTWDGGKVTRTLAKCIFPTLSHTHLWRLIEFGQFDTIVSHASLIFGAKACIETKIFFLTQSIHAKRTPSKLKFSNGSPIHVKQLEIFLVGSSAQQLQTKFSSQNSWLRSGQRGCSSHWQKEQLLFVQKFHAMGGVDRNAVILGNCGS